MLCWCPLNLHRICTSSGAAGDASGAGGGPPPRCATARVARRNAVAWRPSSVHVKSDSSCQGEAQMLQTIEYHHQLSSTIWYIHIYVCVIIYICDCVYIYVCVWYPLMPHWYKTRSPFLRASSCFFLQITRCRIPSTCAVLEQFC